MARNNINIIGYNEYLDEEGKYAFSIESKSIKSEFFLLKYDFYEEIMNQNKIVKNNQDKIYLSKLLYFIGFTKALLFL